MFCLLSIHYIFVEAQETREESKTSCVSLEFFYFESFLTMATATGSSSTSNIFAI
jgi:hypothetical protein